MREMLFSKLSSNIHKQNKLDVAVNAACTDSLLHSARI